MHKKDTLLVAGSLLFGLLLCQPTNARSAAPTADSRATDLRAMNEWVETEASFNAAGRAQAKERIKELLLENPPKTEAGFFLEIASIVGLADNAHSNLRTTPIYGFGLVPIRTYWFSDGLYIVRARSEYADLLGARIELIAGHTPAELVQRLDPYHGGTAGHFRQYFSVPMLLSPPLLFAAGVSPDLDKVALTLALPDGAKRHVQLPTDRSEQRPGRTRPWQRLLQNSNGGATDAWAVVEAAEPPLAFQEANQAFRYVYLEPEKVAYIQFRSNIDQGGTAIWKFAKSAEEWLLRDKPQAIILDNRFNPGGDLQRTAKLALGLPTFVPDHGAVYVLTSNATFSAGIYTSFFPKSTDPERTFVLGEHVGDRSRFFAESFGPFVLSESGYRIGQSIQMHDLGKGCPEKKRCHLAGRKRMDIAVGNLEPDVVIATNFQDFLDGRDPVLEHALKAAGGRIETKTQ